MNLRLTSITYPTRDTPGVTGRGAPTSQPEEDLEDLTEIQVASTPPYLLVPDRDPRVLVEPTVDSPS
jgi:hypothetical protein